MNILISIIVPVYKVELYLDKCIESIVNQTYKNLEIILVDDGSTDQCPDKCDKWALKDARIEVIHKKMVDYQMRAMRELKSNWRIYYIY